MGGGEGKGQNKFMGEEGSRTFFKKRPINPSPPLNSCMVSSLYQADLYCLKLNFKADLVPMQAVVRKFGKDEDEHVVASDAELDTKLDLFKFEIFEFKT